MIHIINITYVSDIRKTYAEITTLSYLITILYLIVTTIAQITDPSKDDFLWKFQRLMHVFSFSAEATVVVFYWAILAEDNISNYDTTCESPEWCLFNTFITHGVVAIPAWTALIFQFTLVRCMDVFWSLGCACVLLFGVNMPVSLFYEQIYDPISYKDIQSYVYIGGGLVLNATGFFLGYVISLIRTRQVRSSVL